MDLVGLLEGNLIGVINPGSYFGSRFNQVSKINQTWLIVKAVSIVQKMGMIFILRK